MDSIDKFGKISSYPTTKGISAYNGINNVVNQLNKDNPNSFDKHMSAKSKEVLSGEIVNLNSNEITVLLDDGETIHAQVYDSSSLSIGQKIKFHLQNNKGVLILEAIQVSDSSADAIITKALAAAKLPVTDRNIAIATELLNNNMSLDSSSLNTIIQQSNLNKSVSVENLILMSKHNIPVNSDNAMELEKYRNYEHRIVKEIDNISTSFPNVIDDVVNTKTFDEILSFNNKIATILSKPSAEQLALNNKALSNINNQVTNTSEFTPIATDAITISNTPKDVVENSHIINKITTNVTSNVQNSKDINHIYSNMNTDINEIIIQNIGELDISKPSNAYLKNAITFNTFDNNSNNLDVSTITPVGRNVENPTVSSAYLKPTSANDILSILEPYNIPPEIAEGIKDGTALLRDVAVVIEKALEMADELDDYRISDYHYSNSSTSSIKYGGITSLGLEQMNQIHSNVHSDDLPHSMVQGTQNTINDVMNKTRESTNYVNISLAKDAFEHPVIKNILDSYEVLQRNNSEISTFLNHYNRGQLTSILRDVPNSDALTEKIWTGNISANELIAELNTVIANADKATVEKLLTSSEYKSVISEAILNNWTISPDALRKPDTVSETYERMYHEINELHNLLSTTVDSSSSKQVLKEFGGMKSNVEFMNTLNNMFSYVQLPLKMRNKNIHSDLYVLTNKQNLKKNNGNISVLLHLDMDYLGTLDVNITLSSNVVTSRFYVSDDFTRELLDKNMEQLEYAMLEKGFILNSNVALKEKDINPINDFLEKDTPSTSIKRYTFDMRM